MKRDQSRAWSLCVAGALMMLSAMSGAAQEKAAVGAASVEEPRLVLCWYMVCYGSSVEFYKQEIELAQRHGIDGFVLDVGMWGNEKSGNQQYQYVKSTERMYEAAKQLNSGFKLLMAPESGVPAVPNLEDMVRRFYTHPSQLKRNGKTVISAYGIYPPEFRTLQEKLQKEGIEISVVPYLYVPRFEFASTPERIYSFYADYPYLDGLMSFDVRPVPEVIRDNAVKSRVSQRLKKIYAAAVVPAYNSANLEDMRGLSGYGAMWEGAIRDGADWISIIIWNDYNEDSGLMPHRWPSGNGKPSSIATNPS